MRGDEQRPAGNDLIAVPGKRALPLNRDRVPGLGVGENAVALPAIDRDAPDLDIVSAEVDIGAPAHHRRILRIARPLAGQADVPPGETVPRIVEKRSEEHTSELQ